ncbi:hypothetical protein I4699_06030 [Xanthomonas hortorum pv. carotae]|uniref:hypothetical protein n=1 Tax=Xanthomonas hortorum TaxID=56454 RepID=UPI00178C7093|nr:hypothetical protein [Xanthomonas hortorum]MBG3849800.1 hypothetical protein [Xanthomonas hortorum pv. carotae]
MSRSFQKASCSNVCDSMGFSTVDDALRCATVAISDAARRSQHSLSKAGSGCEASIASSIAPCATLEACNSLSASVTAVIHCSVNCSVISARDPFSRCTGYPQCTGFYRLRARFAKTLLNRMAEVLREPLKRCFSSPSAADSALARSLSLEVETAFDSMKDLSCELAATKTDARPDGANYSARHRVKIL